MLLELMTTEVAGIAFVTVTLQTPTISFPSSEVAKILHVPAVIPVINPVKSTSAIAGSELLHS